jgi:iron complex outermembrane receptor protein
MPGGPALALPDTDPGAAIEPIIVTARNRDESLEAIPVSITALNGATLAQDGIKDLVQAATRVPGMIFSRAPDDGLALTFRGLGTAARSQAFELSEALFVDGVFMGKGRLYTTSLFDVDRMEFIQGTQSTLLGKNSSLGAISVVTREPGDQPSLEAAGGYQLENGGGYTTDVAGDLPLGERVSVRLAAHDNDLAGWVHNDFTDHWGPEQRDSGLRATLRAQPVEALVVTGSYQYADNQRVGSSYQLVGQIPPAYGDGLLDGHTQQFTADTANGDTLHDTRSQIARLKGELDLGGQTLVVQSSYVRYALHFIDDFDFSKDNSVNFLRDERYHQFTQELRLQSAGDTRFEYMGGLYFLTSHWDSLERQLWAVPAFPPPPAPTSGQLFNGPFANAYLQDSKTWSAFASGTWHLADGLRLAGGLRVTRESKDVLFGRTALAPLTLWNTIANPPFDPTPLALRSDFLDGNLSLQADLARDVMGYIAAAHGSKAGGFAETNTIAVPPNELVDGKVPAALVAAGSAVKDEFTKDYEIGLKSLLFGRRMVLNVDGFWTDVRNFQDTVFTGGPLGFITFNGPARSRGMELQGDLRLSSRWRVDGGMTYADATGVIQPIDPATQAPQVDAQGRPVYATYTRSQAPKLILNTDLHYEAPLRDTLALTLGAGLRHRSMMYNQRQDMFPSTALTTVDLRAGLGPPTGHWSVALVVRNVFNRIAEDFASPSVDPRFSAYYGAHLAGSTPTRTAMIAASVRY